ncbi:hypothetical protein JCM14076_21580 [Methylosoma difficile]
MNVKSLAFIGLAAAWLAVNPISANAASIPGLFNTGAGITVSGTQDTNYTLTKVAGKDAGTNYGYSYAQVGSGFPIGPWLADSSSSHWLTPSANRSESYDPVANGDGYWKWSLSFSLTGLDASTAAFTGHFAADNSAVAYLNGVQIGTASGFTQWYSFAATSGLFKVGLNTLDFVVKNNKQDAGNPIGLRAEFLSSSAQSYATPVPAAIWLFGSAFAGLVATAKRKRQ